MNWISKGSTRWPRGGEHVSGAGAVSADESLAGVVLFLLGGMMLLCWVERRKFNLFCDDDEDTASTMVVRDSRNSAEH